MLVLSRRIGESICIGDDILITVIEARKDKIRLAIQAPRSVLVDREEVRKRRLEFAETNGVEIGVAPESNIPAQYLSVHGSQDGPGQTATSLGKTRLELING